MAGAVLCVLETFLLLYQHPDLGKMNESPPPKKPIFRKVPFTKIVVTFDLLGVERADWTKLKLQSPKTTLVYQINRETRALTARQVANHHNRLITRSGIYIYTGSVAIPQAKTPPQKGENGIFWNLKHNFSSKKPEEGTDRQNC